MTAEIKEILGILQEECAEVIQAISKINRFGMTGIDPRDQRSNQLKLEQELGDLLCMIELLKEQGLIDHREIDQAALNKRAKLRQWSAIFN